MSRRPSRLNNASQALLQVFNSPEYSYKFNSCLRYILLAYRPKTLKILSLVPQAATEHHHIGPLDKRICVIPQRVPGRRFRVLLLDTGAWHNRPMKPRVYVETSVISYLTARPSRDLIMAAHQEVSREWWQNQRFAFELFYSEAVRSEAAMGDPQAAAQRLALLTDMGLLEIPLQAMELANALVDATALPPKARVDALHIAVAAYEKMDFVLTWNFKHIANAQSANKVRYVCESFGLTCPVLCSPLELLEVN